MQRYNKAIVAAVGLLAYLLAQFGVELPAEQQQQLVTVIVALVPVLVYAVPNRP